MRPLLLLSLFPASVGCIGAGDLAMGDALDAAAPPSTSQAIHEVCPDGATVFGIDVSYYQGNINWTAVKNDGVKFAFIRVSDGTGFQDPKFAANWSGARSAGVLRGAYQFFRSDDDPIAQADLLIATMGALEPDDLPPVVDVESTDGVGAAARVTKLRTWLDRVEAATGVQPIIYTGGYFWQDNVASSEFSDHPLWHAGYTGGTCPSTIANQWSDWAFWQYSSTGSVAGIAGNVDTNRFNGSLDQLLELSVGGAVCGDGRCSAGEGGGACTADCPICEPLGAEGGVISEAGPCFEGGGPQQYLRAVSDAGEGGGLVWTHTTDAADEFNFGEWTVLLSAPGRYRVEAYTAAAYAQSAQATYLITHDGAQTNVLVDQTVVDGWTTIAAELTFSGDGSERVHVGDNTGEPGANNTQLVLDAIRLVRLDGAEGEGEGEQIAEGEGEVIAEGEGEVIAEGEGDRPRRIALIAPPGGDGGCSESAGSTWTMAIALALLAQRRRRAR